MTSTEHFNEHDRLRDEARAAGFDASLTPESLGIELESADDFLARMQSEDAHADSKRRTIRSLVIACSAVAAAAVVAVAVLQPWTSPTAAADTPPVLPYEFADAQNIAHAPGKDATATLRRLAKTASETPAASSGGTYQHVVTDNWYANIDDKADQDSVAVIPTVNETWLSADGGLRLLERRGAPLAADGRGLPQKGSWDDLPAKSDETQEAGSIDAQAIADLPRRSSALKAALLKLTQCDTSGQGPQRARCLLTQIDQYNSFYVLPPRVTAAFWSLLADQDAARLLGTVKDRAGREGVGISLIPPDRKQYRFVYIVSPATGRLLGIEEILIRFDPNLKLRTPAITRFTAFLESGFSNRSGTRK
jgi:hypothetical protein